MFSLWILTSHIPHLHGLLAEGLAWLHLPTGQSRLQQNPDVLILSANADAQETRLEQTLEQQTAFTARLCRTVFDCALIPPKSSCKIIIANGWNAQIKEMLTIQHHNMEVYPPLLVLADAPPQLLGNLAEDAIKTGAQMFLPWSLGTAPLLAYIEKIVDAHTPKDFSAVLLNHKARTVCFKDQNIYLPRHLYALFHFMTTHSGEALSCQQLTQALSDGRKVFIEPNTLVVKIYRLRRMFEPVGLHHCLETVPGYGYRYTGPKTISREAG